MNELHHQLLRHPRSLHIPFSRPKGARRGCAFFQWPRCRCVSVRCVASKEVEYIALNPQTSTPGLIGIIWQSHMECLGVMCFCCPSLRIHCHRTSEGVLGPSKTAYINSLRPHRTDLVRWIHRASRLGSPFLNTDDGRGLGDQGSRDLMTKEHNLPEDVGFHLVLSWELAGAGPEAYRSSCRCLENHLPNAQKLSPKP